VKTKMSCKLSLRSHYIYNKSFDTFSVIEMNKQTDTLDALLVMN